MRDGNLLVKIMKLILIMVFISIKNAYTENQNIFISGITNSQSNNIMWELSKI